MKPASLIEYSHAIVSTSDLEQKIALSKEAAQLWHKRKLGLGIKSRIQEMPERPGRPEKPELLSPKEMPKRSARGTKSKIALLHSLAHIELNAIDMTWDLIGRFGWARMPSTFFDNWVRVGVEEAKHFDLLRRHLKFLGTHYGALPAHDGLWQAAQDTGNDLLARIAIVPLVLEARGLDVNPAMIKKMTDSGDEKSASILTIIYNDEKNHVAFGYKWFRYLCEKEGRVPETTFHRLVRKHFKGNLKPPFNDKARSEAGLTPGFYKPLTALGGYGEKIA